MLLQPEAFKEVALKVRVELTWEGLVDLQLSPWGDARLEQWYVLLVEAEHADQYAKVRKGGRWGELLEGGEFGVSRGIAVGLELDANKLNSGW